MPPRWPPRIPGGLALAGPLLALAAGAALAAPEAVRAAAELLPRAGIVAAPLVTSLGRDEALENDLRRRIYHTVREEPGICASEIADEVGAAWGTVIYHLQALEGTGYVVSLKHGRHRRFFENGAVGRDKEALAVLKRETTAEVYETIREDPGRPQKAIAEAVDLTPQALAWHVDELVAAGLVEKERDGRLVRHHPTEKPLAAV